MTLRRARRRALACCGPPSVRRLRNRLTIVSFPRVPAIIDHFVDIPARLCSAAWVGSHGGRRRAPPRHREPLQELAHRWYTDVWGGSSRGGCEGHLRSRPKLLRRAVCAQPRPCLGPRECGAESLLAWAKVPAGRQRRRFGRLSSPYGGAAGSAVGGHHCGVEACAWPGFRPHVTLPGDGGAPWPVDRWLPRVLRGRELAWHRDPHEVEAASVGFRCVLCDLVGGGTAVQCAKGLLPTCVVDGRTRRDMEIARGAVVRRFVV